MKLPYPAKTEYLYGIELFYKGRDYDLFQKLDVDFWNSLILEEQESVLGYFTYKEKDVKNGRTQLVKRR